MTNLLGLVAKGFFRCQNILIPCISISQKTYCHFSPLGYQQTGAERHFQYNSDKRLLFSFLQVSIFCDCLFDDYFANQFTSAKVLVAMAPKVVAAERDDYPERVRHRTCYIFVKS